MTVHPSQRFTRRDPCPICGGGADLPRGRGERCHGFVGDDGRYAHCTREEHAGQLDFDAAGTFPHRLDGPCPCGATHREGATDPPSAKLRVSRPTRATPSDVPAPAAKLCPPGFQEARVYPWRDEVGAVWFETVRYDHPTKRQTKKPDKPEKTFRIRRPVLDQPDRFLSGLGDAPRIVFRKDRLAERPGEELHWTEGEEHTLALEALGLLATTTAGGANGIRAYDAEELRWAARGRSVVVHADNDRDGDAYVDWLTRIIDPVAISLRVLRYPEAGPGGDVLDWIRVGGTAEELRRRIGDAPAWKPTGAKEPARLIVARLSDVTTKPIEWFWPGRLARGKLHVLGGDYGDGKSTLMAWLAATLSTGGDWPDGGGAPVANVLFLLLEDGIDDTLKPRLEIHGADQGRIFAIEAVSEGEGTRRVFRLDRHLDLLRAFVHEQAIALIIIDPLSAFMTGANRDAEGAVRDLLTPMIDLANELGVAIIALMHTGKPGVGAAGRKPTQRLLGSTAFPAVARVVWMLAPTPDDPSRKVLAVTKSNLGLKPAPLEWSRDLDQPIAWHGASEHDIAQLFDAIKPMPREEAKAWLVEALAGGRVPQRIVEARARELGISSATLKRAREDLGVESVKQSGVVNGPWLWELPKGRLAVTAGEASEDPHLSPAVVSVSDGAPPRRAASPTSRSNQIPDDLGKTLTVAASEPLRRPGAGTDDACVSYTTVSYFDASPTLVAANGTHDPHFLDESRKKLTRRRREPLGSPRIFVEEAQALYLQGELLRSADHTRCEDAPP